MKIFREGRKDAAFHATRQRGKKCCGSVAGLLLFLLPLISLMVNRVAGVAPFSRSYIIPSFGQASAKPGLQMGCPAATANELSHSTEYGEEPIVTYYLIDHQRCSQCYRFFEIYAHSFLIGVSARVNLELTNSGTVDFLVVIMDQSGRPRRLRPNALASVRRPLFLIS